MFYTSTFTEQKDVALAISLGADRFVTKPQDADVLLKIICEMLATAGQTDDSHMPIGMVDEDYVLKEYSEALFHKLEKKMADLEKANWELAEREYYFRQFFMECPMPISIADMAGKYELFNNRHIATFGYTLEEVPTVEAWMLRVYPDPDYRAFVTKSWQEAMIGALGSSGIVHADEEYPIACKDGTTRVMQIYAAPVSGKLVAVFNDVTEQRQTEKERAEMQAQMLQQDKMASLGQLAAGVVHEINNPIGFIGSNLNTLLRYTERLKAFVAAIDACDAQLPDAVRERLSRVRTENKIDFLLRDIEAIVHESLDGTDRVKSIVKDLKSFSRADESAGKMADINAGIESTINIVWNELKYKATVERAYGELPHSFCNPGQLSQVFMNLLVNAAHAIEKQGRISVKTWADGGVIFVQISDTGSGIAPDKLQKIFEPFFTTKEAGKGTGLGLSISREIIEKHGGEIAVESEIGKGTVFTIKLPVRQADEESLRRQ